MKKSQNLVPRPDAPVLGGNRNHPSLPSQLCIWISLLQLSFHIFPSNSLTFGQVGVCLYIQLYKFGSIFYVRGFLKMFFYLLGRITQGVMQRLEVVICLYICLTGYSSLLKQCGKSKDWLNKLKYALVHSRNDAEVLLSQKCHWDVSKHNFGPLLYKIIKLRYNC